MESRGRCAGPGIGLSAALALGIGALALLALGASDRAWAAPKTLSTPSSKPFYFFDRCWASRSTSVKKARRTCRHLGKTGPSYQRIACRCRPAHLVTVRPTDPIVFYFVVDNRAYVGKTAKEASAACLRDKKKKPSPADGVDCAKVRPAYGPYKRVWAPGPYDDAKLFVYLDQREGIWLDRTGEAPCFVAGTLVRTPSGVRPIESLRVGDSVISWDLVRRKALTSKVEATRITHGRRVMRLTLANGTVLGVTARHPFYLPRRRLWVRATELRPGVTLMIYSGPAASTTTVSSLRWLDQPATVYNLSVSGPQNYFAGGVLVHNY